MTIIWEMFVILFATVIVITTIRHLYKRGESERRLMQRMRDQLSRDIERSMQRYEHLENLVGQASVNSAPRSAARPNDARQLKEKWFK